MKDQKIIPYLKRRLSRLQSEAIGNENKEEPASEKAMFFNGQADAYANIQRVISQLEQQEIPTERPF